jgi:integrase
VTAPKTNKGRAPVPVIKPLCMNNVLKRAILPALDRCEHCRKSNADHGKADHPFKRDERYPEWHGWHAARRGLGSNLYRLGVPEMIQRILRHANVSTTNTYYIKSAADDVRSAMATLEQHLPSGIVASKVLRDTQRTLNLESPVAPATFN